ncbi:MAG: single-stranded-DNA-specific exonuclease RecJ [Parasporobacterium sp.]|nr:single-stranded-DNA-specific exonuclease RecJ [Parasporobacterium sp.]
MEQLYLYCKKADFNQISGQFNISPILARILVNRDIPESDMEEYLYGDVNSMADPFLMKDMERAVNVITDCLAANGKIMVVGDYDVDGVCSGYILETYLNFLGADVSVRLPNRITDGYGLNENMVRDFAENGVNLIITADNGISASPAALTAKELGIKLVVTDHHQIPVTLPEADAVIDPKQEDCTYPFKELCGAAVAYKLVKALESRLDADKKLQSEKLTDELLQFAGMATIADIVPLKGENRIFAKEGIKRLRTTSNIGLKALYEVRSLDPAIISSYHIGFVLGPCINSAGRLKDASLALSLLKETDYSKALKTAGELAELNEVRKDMTAKQISEAGKLIEEMGDNPDKVVVLYLPEAHESVAGIVAGKIKDDLNRPVIVLTNSAEGYKGSGRSTDAYNMIEELSAHPELFAKFGGHAKAAGFTLKVHYDEMRKVLNESCTMTDEDMVRKIWLDMPLPLNYITEELVEEIKLMEPFGMGNQRPSFGERDVEVLNFNVYGRLNNVLKLSLRTKDGHRVDGVYFAPEEKIAEYQEQLTAKKQAGEPVKVTFAYYPSINEFRGMKTPQAVITFLKISE